MSELHLVEQEEVGEGALVELVHSRSPQRRPVSELRYQSQGIGSFRAISGETPHAQRFLFLLGLPIVSICCCSSQGSEAPRGTTESFKDVYSRVAEARQKVHLSREVPGRPAVTSALLARLPQRLSEVNLP